MLNIFNSDFFSFNLFFDRDESSTNVLVNAMVEPKLFELSKYKKTPFATFSATTNALSIMDINVGKVSADQFIDEYLTDVSYNQYSMYGDDEYDIIMKHFPNNRAGTLIFHTDNPPQPDIKNGIELNAIFDKDASVLNKIVLLIAMPIQGIVAPVRKSNQFKLYNGSFIPCKTFNWDGAYYNKLIYFLVDMHTSFSFQEYVLTNHDNVGLMHNYYFSLDSYGDVVMNKLTSMVPYCGRETLFTKPDKNLFYLSDIPSDIINRKSTISVPLNS